jgi:hypothetical protein
MPETACLVTVDAEGDDLWSRPRDITTRNARCLPRFQALCERFGFKPVYLANHEMAHSAAFVEFARDVLKRGAGEVGMHLHAWSSPPHYDLTGDDDRHQPYLIEYPERVMRAKIRALTRLLEERFGRRMVSHRAGRWAFDGRYAAMLADEGYLVDCSVTPGVDWRAHAGDPRGRGGTDYRRFPEEPYLPDPADVSRPGAGPLLEVPLTSYASALYRLAPWAYRTRGLRRAARLASQGIAWLCLAEADLPGMLALAARARARGARHVQLMLHSSELMPGGSPRLRSAGDVERLYEHIEIVFERLRGFCRGMTLEEFHAGERSLHDPSPGTRSELRRALVRRDAAA